MLKGKGSDAHIWACHSPTLPRADSDHEVRMTHCLRLISSMQRALDVYV